MKQLWFTLLILNIVLILILSFRFVYFYYFRLRKCTIQETKEKHNDINNHPEIYNYKCPFVKNLKNFYSTEEYPELQLFEENRSNIVEETKKLIETQYHIFESPGSSFTDHTVGRTWKKFWIMRSSTVYKHNAQLVPTIFKLLKKVNYIREAFISEMKPHSTIPTHTGSGNYFYTVHVPLLNFDQSYLHVNNEKRYHKDGIFVFDDSMLHGAVNPSDKSRFVLIFSIKPFYMTKDQHSTCENTQMSLLKQHTKAFTFRCI